MKQDKKKLPVGIDHFEKLRLNDFYYVDKTGLIKKLLNNRSKVKLLTRPRRFGKSLNMSMLENFFSIQKKQQIFCGLKIINETALCEEYMGKFPVISISLKNVNATSFECAFQLVAQIIAEAAEKVQFLMESNQLTEYNKREYQKLLEDMSETEVLGSLKKLTHLLFRHYNMPVILLIDEYDVPLAKAYENGYYKQMVVLIRNLFDQTLKENENLKFAVLSGCMRLPQESIFNGVDHLHSSYISDIECNKYFGFTEEEIKEILVYYEYKDKYPVIKEWYKGYQFGNVEVYCPWDIVCYCAKLRVDQNAQPESYWINTSSNEILGKFIQEAENSIVKREIEKLMEGEVVVKEIHSELSYDNIDQSMERMWNILYWTGYLTQCGRRNEKVYKLAIPNKEIGTFFATQIMAHFKENVSKNKILLKHFYTVLEQGEAMEVQVCLREYLKKMIEIRATYCKNVMEEKYYQEFLLAILQKNDQWIVETDQWENDATILIKTGERGEGIIIAVKYMSDGKLDSVCKEVGEQISDSKYREWIEEHEIQKILKYGIACYKKQCRVEVEK